MRVSLPLLNSKLSNFQPWSSLLRSVLCVLLASSATAMHGQAHPSASVRQPKPPQPTISYRITGTVVNSVGGGRVPHCHLSAEPEGSGSSSSRRFPSDSTSSDCDESGHFAISLPSAGSWRLSASAPGFVTQAYDEHQFFSSSVVLTAAKPTIDLEFRINPESVITGIVLDEAGEPVRNAQVSLQVMPESEPGEVRPVGGVRTMSRTDDRGIYELANIAPGSYRVSVQAQPWYAAMAQSRRGVINDAAPYSSDPSLDVTYPTVWFPGVDDPAQSETITLHPGDTRQADFRLTPVPSIHLHILLAAPVATESGRPALVFPMVQQILPGGGQNFVPVTVYSDTQGQLDIGGLAPGVYQVRVGRVGMSNQEGHSNLIEVAAGSSHTLNLADASNEATVTLHFDGTAETESRSIQVNFIDTAGRGLFPGNFDGRFGGDGGPGGLRRRERREPEADRTVELPPGRYEVVLQGRQDLFLTGLTAKGAETFGRYITVAAGSSTLTLHITSGRAAITGIANLDGKSLSGALVLLVPTSVEDGTGLRVVRRDQSNTDGSFELADVIPGQYILVAIDHGWQINWGDPATLRRYLTHGIPISLTANAKLTQNIDAQAP